jgi:hypothetical protein
MVEPSSDHRRATNKDLHHDETHMDQRGRVSTSFSTTGVAAAVRWSRVGPSFVSSELIGLYLAHLILLAWKRVIRARGGLDPQWPSLRPPSALGWVTSDEWAHGWSTSTARAPRRQRRPRRPTHPHQACAPWSTCSLPIAGDCASSVPDGEHACSRHRRVSRVVWHFLHSVGQHFLSRSTAIFGRLKLHGFDTADNKRQQDTLATHTRSSCKCT